MEYRRVTIITEEPTIEVLAEMKLDEAGVLNMASWVKKYRPRCVPESGFETILDLVPHDGYDIDARRREEMGLDTLMRPVTDNELLAELAGRKCFDSVTEVLTPSGWVAFPELRRGTPVATLNCRTVTMEFQTPTDYIEKRHVGRMYCAESRAFSIRTTDDHDMWVRPQRGAPWRFAPTSEVAGRPYGIRRCAPYTAGESVDDAWAAFLGFYIAEGSLVDGKKYGVGSRVVLYQRPKTAAVILTLVDALGYNSYVKTDPRNGVLHITINNTDLATKLAEHGTLSHNKRLPKQVFGWSPRARSVLLDALMAGDGTVTKGARVYTTTSQQLADDVQTLILMSGRPGTISSMEPSDGTGTSFRGNHRVYRVREGSQEVAEVNARYAQHDFFEDADEVVYCVTVPNRVLFVRRNKKIFTASNCYDSFADAGAKRTNGEYLASMWQGQIPHRSTGYHPKMSFFFGDVSRRVSHELIRNYVGADRDEEGNPSQESTRFTHHYGAFIAPVRDLDSPERLASYRDAMQSAYNAYRYYIAREVQMFADKHGAEPKGMDRKRIYEAASNFLPHSCATSWIWTTNPMALAKLFAERCHEAADAEFYRFAAKLKRICMERWPNLFPHVER